MGHLPNKCLVDTNVPKTANLAKNPAEIPGELIGCVLNCVEAIEHVVKNGGLVIDSKDEIFLEYRRNLSLSGKPGIGDRFMKWVHDNRWKFPEEDRVPITSNNGSYDEFPHHVRLDDFDRSDKKFIAVANAHPEKPEILEATDSKWWGWKDPLLEVGIRVNFLCSDYARAKYAEKMDV
jgi:hypothetical protein